MNDVTAPAAAAVVAVIDDTLEGRCGCGCGQLLDPDGPSAWFATPDCQQAYQRRQATKPEQILGPLLRGQQVGATVSIRMFTPEETAAALAQANAAGVRFAAEVRAVFAPFLTALAGAMTRFVETVLPGLRQAAEAVDAHMAARHAYRRHLHTTYRRRQLARRRRARR